MKLLWSLFFLTLVCIPLVYCHVHPPDQWMINPLDRTSAVHSKTLSKRGKRPMLEETSKKAPDGATLPPKKPRSQRGSGRINDRIITVQTGGAQPPVPAQVSQSPLAGRISRDASPSKRGAIHQASRLRAGTIQEFLHAYWRSYEARIDKLAPLPLPRRCLRARKQRQDAERTVQPRIRERLDQDLTDFLRPRAGQPTSEHRKSREGLWWRFRSRWKQEEIREQEYAKLPYQTRAYALCEHYWNIYEAHARDFINRVEAQKDKVLFRRRSSEGKILFLGEVDERTIVSPERMAVVAAARAAEDYALTVFPYSCSRAGSQRASYSNFKKASHF